MNPCILLAEHDGALRESYREYLARAGYRVAVAGDGLACLDELRRCRPDLLVLDPDVPWGAGAGVLERMCDEEEFPLVPVLMLSDRPDAGGDSEEDNDVIRGYCLKPVGPAQLAEGVRLVLRERGAIASRQEARRAAGVSPPCSIQPPVVLRTAD